MKYPYYFVYKNDPDTLFTYIIKVISESRIKIRFLGRQKFQFLSPAYDEKRILSEVLPLRYQKIEESELALLL